MKMAQRTILSILGLILCLASGCYWKRLTYHYKDLEELTDSPEALLDVSGVSAEELDQQLQLALEQYSNEKRRFTINGGDVLSVRVYEQPELNTQVVVAPDGYLNMLLAGQVMVGGLTPAEAATAIEEALEEYIVNPKVGVSPVTIHSETVTITGAIKKSGMFVIREGMRLADLYAEAGSSEVRLYDNMYLDAAVLEQALFFREGKTLPVSFTRAIKQGDVLHNVRLRKDDYIYIPAKDDNLVYVIGDVGAPQKRIWNETMGLLELLAACGWVRETNWDHVIIIRGGFAEPQMFKVDLGSILVGKKRNVRILAGDIIYLPKDDISEYNVFVRKLMPTFQLINNLRGL